MLLYLVFKLDFGPLKRSNLAAILAWRWMDPTSIAGAYVENRGVGVDLSPTLSWPDAERPAFIAFFALAVCVAFGLPLGIWAAIAAIVVDAATAGKFG